jgi:hypothetical protein
LTLDFNHAFADTAAEEAAYAKPQKFKMQGEVDTYIATFDQN